MIAKYANSMTKGTDGEEGCKGSDCEFPLLTLRQ